MSKKIISLIFCFFGSVFLSHTENAIAESNEQYKKKWESAIKSNPINCDAALFYISKAIEIDPQDSNAYWMSSFTKRDCGNPQGGIDDATVVIELNKNIKGQKLIDTWVPDAYYSRGFSKEVIADSNWKKMKDAPTIFENDMYKNKALTQYREAISDYTNAINIAREYVSAYWMRGRVYEKIFRKDLACFDYRTGWKLGDERMGYYAKTECGYDSPALFRDIACDYAKTNKYTSTLSPKDEDMNLFVKNECGL